MQITYSVHAFISFFFPHPPLLEENRSWIDAWTFVCLHATVLVGKDVHLLGDLNIIRPWHFCLGLAPG